MASKERWIEELQKMRQSHETLSQYVQLYPSMRPHVVEIAKEIETAQTILARDGFTRQDNQEMVSLTARYSLAVCHALLILEAKPKEYLQ